MEMKDAETFLTLNPAFEKQSSLSLVPATASPTESQPQDAGAEVKPAVAGENEPKTKTGADVSSGDATDAATTDSLPLQYKWTVWEQVQRNAHGANDYKQTTREIATFSSVEAFWRLFQSLPQPSELLTSKRMIREEGGMQPVDAIMIFREGVEPMWEDPMNICGGHFEYKVNQGMPPAQADEYWNNLVLGMVGGTLEPNDMITGIRLVDKMDRKMIRLELWFTEGYKSNAENERREKLMSSAKSIMASKLNGSVGKELEGFDKPHSKTTRR